jgi:ABC-type phosphate transport system substrate-binding protein
MRRIRNTAIMGAVTAVALLGLGTGTALADPPSGTTPAATDIVGVGSDTVTPLFSGSPTENTVGSLVTDYNATNPASKLWSWDAVNPSTGTPGDSIVTKSGCASIARPNGSGAGITALEQNATDGNGDFCVDFARSSRAKASTDPTSIAFVAEAGDAIAWSSPEGTGVTSPVPSTLTVAQLKAIYLCQDTNWNQVGGSNAPIVPVLPQSGSGTLATFLLALGGGTTPLVPGSCVVNANGKTAIEENTGLSAGNVAQFDPDGVPAVDDLYPYSIGDFIAQGTAANGVGGHASPIWGHGVLAVHAATTTTGGVVEQPTTTNASGQTIINRSYPSELQRTLYNVVRNGGSATAPAFPTTPSYEATALPALFGPSGWVCTNATAQADILSYGFFNLGRGCGVLTVG